MVAWDSVLELQSLVCLGSLPGIHLSGQVDGHAVRCPLL